jgi:alkylhydroperoxidase family enzyme
MSYIRLSDYGSTPFEKLMGHVPEILNKWEQLETVFFQSKQFSPEFLEQVRRALAFNNACHYCMSKAGPPDKNIDSVRLEEALRFANKFAIDHMSIDKNEIERMKQYFSEKELIEFIAFCSFISASQKFGASLRLQSIHNY